MVDPPTCSLLHRTKTTLGIEWRSVGAGGMCFFKNDRKPDGRSTGKSNIVDIAPLLPLSTLNDQRRLGYTSREKSRESIEGSRFIHKNAMHRVTVSPAAGYPRFRATVRNDTASFYEKRVSVRARP